MGNSETKARWVPKPIDKNRYEIAVTKVAMYLQLYRDRRQGEVKTKEKTLLEFLKKPKRNKDEEISKAQSVVADLNYIKAANIVLRFCDILKDRTFEIVSNQGDASKIPELRPYIESVIWAARRLNLTQVQEFTALVGDCFGPDILTNIERSTMIDLELRECFKNIIPTPWEVNAYWAQFAEKYNISVEEINKAGHGIGQLPPNPQEFAGMAFNPAGVAPGFAGMPPGYQPPAGPAPGGFGAPGAGPMGPGFVPTQPGGGVIAGTGIPPGFGGQPGGYQIPQSMPFNPNPYAAPGYQNPMTGVNIIIQPGIPGAPAPGMGGGQYYFPPGVGVPGAPAR